MSFTKTHILLLINGEEITINRADFLKIIGAKGLIRVPDAEFSNIDFTQISYGHFNFKETDHIEGQRYLIVRIMRNGSYASEDKDEQPPLLSLEGAFLMECTQVKNNIPYGSLSPEHFRYSMKNLKDAESLETTMIKRYTSSTGKEPEEILKEGAGFTLMNLISPVRTVLISQEEDFQELSTESISSKTFIKEGTVYKINKRNSFYRQFSDLQKIRERLPEYLVHIAESEPVICFYNGEFYSGIIQPFIVGKELRKIEQEELKKMLISPSNKKFLSALLIYFFKAIENKELYPDIVGYPGNPEYFNSINLMLEKNTGKIILCDVGLSPHEDTLQTHGKDFYEGNNIKIYLEKMRTFKQYLESLPL